MPKLCKDSEVVVGFSENRMRESRFLYKLVEDTYTNLLYRKLKLFFINILAFGFILI